MKNTMKIITRNEVQKLNSNDVIGYILSDGEFIINEPNVVQETSQSADKRFCYGDFDEFVFDHDLGNLEYIIIKDESKVSGSSTLEVAGKLTYEQEQPQSTVKNIIEDLKELTSRPYAYVGNDVDSLGDLIGDTLEKLYEALGIELQDQETAEQPSDNIPAEDKLNVDMLRKLHEVQDHVLRSGQTAVGANLITTAFAILEAGLGVMGKVEG